MRHSDAHVVSATAKEHSLSTCYGSVAMVKTGICVAHIFLFLSETLTRPTGTPDFQSPTGGGGGVRPPPFISAPIGGREKRKKRSKARQK